MQYAYNKEPSNNHTQDPKIIIKLITYTLKHILSLILKNE